MMFHIELQPNETIWVQYIIDDQVKYIIITKNRLREVYYLYAVTEGGLKYIAEDESPLKLDKIVWRKEKKKGINE